MKKRQFRPIVMTSLAFGFGVLPLAITTNVGAGAQNAIGNSVLGALVRQDSEYRLFGKEVMSAFVGNIGQPKENHCERLMI